MPYECEDNRDVYNDYMSTIVAFCNGINSTCIFIVGDFNADISKTSVFGSILHDFCNDFSFSIADKDYLPAETYTYVSPAWGTTSWLDHVICTADARGCVTDMTVLYERKENQSHVVSYAAKENYYTNNKNKWNTY